MDGPKSKTPACRPGQFDARQMTLEQAPFSPEPVRRATIRGQMRRALLALQDGPISREQLDKVCSASNSPDVVGQLRARGLKIVCTKQAALNRRGEPCRFGVYSLPPGQSALTQALLNDAEARHGN